MGQAEYVFFSFLFLKSGFRKSGSPTTIFVIYHRITNIYQLWALRPLFICSLFSEARKLVDLTFVLRSRPHTTLHWRHWLGLRVSFGTWELLPRSFSMQLESSWWLVYSEPEAEKSPIPSTSDIQTFKVFSWFRQTTCNWGGTYQAVGHRNILEFYLAAILSSLLRVIEGWSGDCKTKQQLACVLFSS
jgi:hypothetical protein